MARPGRYPDNHCSDRSTVPLAAGVETNADGDTFRTSLKETRPSSRKRCRQEGLHRSVPGATACHGTVKSTGAGRGR